jgi:hypothetical protein
MAEFLRASDALVVYPDTPVSREQFVEVEEALRVWLPRMQLVICAARLLRFQFHPDRR